MSDLYKYFSENEGNVIDKWLHYFDIYESYFSSFKDRPVNILEIGVFQGGSLLMWKSYFHKDSKIFGIDFNPECKMFEGDNISIHIGSQADMDFLSDFLSKNPKFDIIIDDGSHRVDHQRLSFEKLFPQLNDGGVYICEDTHTSYWRNYGGGLGHRNSFVEYSKKIVDDLNAWHSREERFKISYFTENVRSVHFYDSMVVFVKGNIPRPSTRRVGKFVIDPGPLKEPSNYSVSRIKRIINRLIRFLR